MHNLDLHRYYSFTELAALREAWCGSRSEDPSWLVGAKNNRQEIRLR
jgi:hypothetical protein